MNTLVTLGANPPTLDSAPSAFTSPAVAVGGFASSFKDYAIPGGGQVRVLENNPRRIAFGAFVFNGMSAARIAPWPDPSSFPFLVLTNGQSQWVSLTEFSLMVCQEWYAVIQDLQTLRILEIVQTV